MVIVVVIVFVVGLVVIMVIRELGAALAVKIFTYATIPMLSSQSPTASSLLICGNLWLIRSTSLYNSIFFGLVSIHTMAGSRKRAPSTPKRTPKRAKTKSQSKGKQCSLPGGALELSFQLDGM